MIVVVVVVVLSSGKIRCHTGAKHKSILCRKRNKLPDTKPNFSVTKHFFLKQNKVS